MLSLSCCTPSTWLNCASWAMNSPLPCGSSGFWLFSWATSRLRNASLPSSSFLVPLSFLIWYWSRIELAALVLSMLMEAPYH
ncbi:hypothetical protein D9M69_413790 [compost metagenome]